MRKSENLVSERLARMPSYLTLTVDDFERLTDSFANIFKSIWSSVKLLASNLLLNLNVVLGSITRDRKWIKDSFAAYQGRRQKYDEETQKNLKYFRKFYSEDNGFGPKALAFAVNPLLFVAAGTGDDDSTNVYSPEDSEPSASATTRTSKISPRLQNALRFFEYEASRGLNEAVTPTAPAKSSPAPEVQKETQRLAQIAKSYVESEKRSANEILEKLAGRMSVIKRIVESKNFDELIVAISSAKAQGIKMFDGGIESAKNKIESDFIKQSKSDPVKFKESVKIMREKVPEITEPDDVKAALQFTFAMAKVRVQAQMVKSYEEFLQEARRLIVPEIDQVTRSQLAATETGQEYLRMIEDFERRLESGEAESAQVKKSFKDATT